MQSRGNGVKRGKNNSFPESTKTIKGHDLYLGSLLFLNKKAPSPRFRSNLYMDYDLVTGRLIIPPEIEKTITILDEMLRGRLENKKIQILEEETVDDLVNDDFEILEDEEIAEAMESDLD